MRTVGRQDTDGEDLRPEIALGWHRSSMCGLDPGMEVQEPGLFEVDRHSRLLRAAGPVINRMVDELADTRFSILLADHAARIVDRRLSDRVDTRGLDRVKAVPGAQYVEEFSGTNSLATAFELRKPIAVVGGEHFLEALRVFCCYGAPIFHPITGRLEGVLDITGPVGDSNALLGPFLRSAIRDIEAQLKEGARLSEQRLFDAFQAETAKKRSAIMLFGESLALSNAAATDLVTSADYPMLQALAADIGPGGELSRSLELTSGRGVDVHASFVADTRDGVLFEVLAHPEEPARRGPRRAAQSRRPADAHLVVITGGPGSGRSTRAEELAGPDAARIDLAGADGRDWRAVLGGLGEGDAVLIDDLHLADASTAAAVRAAVGSAAHRSVVVCGDTEDLSTEHRALIAVADRVHAMPALHAAGDALPRIVDEVLERVAGTGPDGHRLRVTPTAMASLAGHDWPGNLIELRSVLTRAARGRTWGDITVEDLPDAYRGQAPARHWTSLERAELTEIRTALRKAGGNKAAVARELGIARNTLYSKLRHYRIDA